MRIKLSETDNISTFGNLQPGDTFRNIAYPNCIFMKAIGWAIGKPSNNTTINAVDIKSGELFDFKDDTVTTEVIGYFTVTEE